MPIHQTEIGPIEMLAEGDGPDSLLLLHAAASGPRALFKLGKLLSEGTTWRAHMPGLHGYGATLLADAPADDPFAAHLRVAQWAGDEVGRRNPNGRRVLLGHSMGGLVALMAMQQGVRPDALVLYEPIVLGLLDLADPIDREAHAWDGARVAKLRTGVESGDPEAGVRAFVEAFNEVPWSDLPAALRADLISKAPQLAAETRSAPKIVLDRAHLRALRLPVLILQGETSPAVTHRMTLRLAQAIPHAVRQIVTGAGHMGPALSAASVARHVAPFLAK